MSLNKFMHPRNKYRKPPNFKALAIKYPEFRKYAQQDISGKIKLNFKNVEAVRALTCTLLKEDFDLDVEIPISRLVPTLPLRLNYLLWIEDLLEKNEKSSDVIKGIDIGCGASCVYPLLAAKQFGWHMLATEVDMDSAFLASRNVRKNNLKSMITVRTVDEGMMLYGVVDASSVYDFCMCNPPFFSSEDELEPQNVSRSANRPPPRNARSGAVHELVVEGGELAFVNKIIQESLKLKGRIRIYSVMMGHKTSVAKVKQALKEAGIEKVTTAEFCQGHTTRWGVAWTLQSDVTLLPPNMPSTHKQKTLYTCTFETELEATVERLKQLMDELQIIYSAVKTDKEQYTMDILAERNTWSNSRKKRRQEKLKLIKSEEKDDNVATTEKSNDHQKEDNVATTEKTNDHEKDENHEISKPKEADAVLTSEVKMEDETNEVECVDSKNEEMDNENNQSKRKHEDAECSEAKRVKLDSGLVEPPIIDKPKEPFLCGSVVVKSELPGSVLELCWLRGVGGREAAHQVVTYFKNNFKTPQPS